MPVNAKSLENLKKGRTKNRGRPVGSGGPSWKDLIEKYGEVEAGSEYEQKLGLSKAVLKKMGLKAATWKLVVVATAYRQSALGNTGMFKELIERQEGKVTQPLGMDKDMPFSPNSISIFVHDDGTP